MAKPYKLTPIELALSPKEHFEDNLDKFINNETIADDEKLILLQNALRRVNKHTPYREKPLKVNVINHGACDSFRSGLCFGEGSKIHLKYGYKSFKSS